MQDRAMKSLDLPLGTDFDAINRTLTDAIDDCGMRVAGAIIVVLLALYFVDEQYNSGRYSRAATMMLSHIARSFG